jgi:hypothetical protein
LLPVAQAYGLDLAADFYSQLTQRARTDGLRLTAAITTGIVQALLQRAGTQAEALRFAEATREVLNQKALPLPTTPPRQRRELPPADTVPPQIPGRASTSQGHSPDDLQNFAEDHRAQPSVPGTPPAGALPDDDHTLNSPGPGQMISILENVLRLVTQVEQAIEDAACCDPFEHGRADELRQEIHQRLVRAAQFYRTSAPEPEPHPSHQQ